MTTGAYYNENEPFAAAWLRELIKAGLIADGEVDERSIADVTADDVRGFTQCHFFAGIGGWSYALRLAGWADDREVWTGSCPCQPFSTAGKNIGGDDARHLWPTWFRLIRECRPVVVFGEQVESAIGHGWIDLVCDDLEGEDYATGPIGLPAACVGAPHNRPRLWFVAHSQRGAAKRFGCALAGEDGQVEGSTQERQRLWIDVRNGGDVSPLADIESRAGGLLLQQRRSFQGGAESFGSGEISDVGDTNGQRHALGMGGGGHDAASIGAPAGQAALETGAARGFWTDAEWIACTDGKARAIEPSTFPLAYGLPNRVGRLRCYGNAINPEVAQVFIEAYMSSVDDRAVVE